jgi:hypothetical protein
MAGTRIKAISASHAGLMKGGDMTTNEHGLNIRFLAQGMVKLSPDDLPEGFFFWSWEDQIKWARERWDNLSRDELMKAIAYLEVEGDSVPDCLEVDNENYDILARTPAWAAFNLTGASVLEPVGEGGATCMSCHA